MNGSLRWPAWVPKLCFALIALLMVVYTVAGAIVRPTMFSDSGWGLLGWYTQARASAFNVSVGPDPADIAREIERFMSTWTPGQHLLPGLVERLGTNLGLAIIAVSAAFSLLGLVGFYSLYRAFGFPLETVAVALLVIACNRFFNLAFTIYNGGEVLLFGVTPWFVLLAWRLRNFRWMAVPTLVAGIAVLVFMKLSGIIFGAAVVGAAAVCGDRAWARPDTLRKILMAGIVVVLAGIIFYFAWFTRGVTAANIIAPSLHPDGLIFYVALAVGSTWSASLSLLDLASWLLMHPSRPLVESVAAPVYLFLPLAVVTFAMTWRRIADAYGEYLRFALLIAAAVAGFLVLMWMSGRTVGLEERHFRGPSLILFVGVAHAFIGSRSRLLQATFAAVAGLACLYGVASFAQRLQANTHYAMGERGVRQMVPPEVVAFVRTIDRPGPDADKTLIFMPSPEVALEVRHARFWSNHADFQPIEELRREVWRGRVDRLYVIMQRKLVGEGKADAILRSFVDYPRDGWKEVPLGDFVCFYQVRD